MLHYETATANTLEKDAAERDARVAKRGKKETSFRPQHTKRNSGKNARTLHDR